MLDLPIPNLSVNGKALLELPVSQSSKRHKRLALIMDWLHINDYS